MKHTFGQSLAVTLFGESHGPVIGATLDGLAPGIVIDDAYIRHCLNQRAARGAHATARREADVAHIVSGVYQGRTTGAPLTVLIENRDVRSADYATLSDRPRPGHADYPAACKYHGYQDVRGGGQFSGRLTAPLVAVGAIVRRALLDRGIRIATHVAALGGIEDGPMLTEADMDLVNARELAVLDEAAAERMLAAVAEVKAQGDSLGGVLETLITGVPAGVGEPFFDSVESTLAHLLFSVPAVKGVEFGAGFEVARMRGSEANDPYAVRDGRIVTLTNHAGGIGGGITNGMPIRIRSAVKPTPSIAKEQPTVSLSAMKDTTLSIVGRHDPTVVFRARAVVDAVLALGIADLLACRFGTDFLGGVTV